MVDTSNNKSNSNFEARLRGKLKGGLGTSLDDARSAPDASSSTTNDLVDPIQSHICLNIPKNEEGVIYMGYDVESGDDYEGQPADSEGYHKYSRRYTGPRMINFSVVIMHNPDDPDWLQKTLAVKKLPGIYSPEGYIWGRNRNEVYYMELMPGMRKSGSLSIAYALDKGRLGVFRTLDGEKPNPEEFPEELFEDLKFLKLACGEPKPFFEIPYDIGYMGTVWLEHAGPERLDRYIPPSELPRWLYVYDEDDVTLPTSSDEVNNEVDDEPEDDTDDESDDEVHDEINDEVNDEVHWFGVGHPVLPIPPNIKPFKYRLIDPTGVNANPDEEPVDPEQDHATLILSKSRVIRTSPSEQYEAQISFQDRRKYPYRLRVAAKLAHSLHPEYITNEATMYNLFPDYFSREYTGVQLVEPSIIPRPLSKVVPCFYGYYEHVPYEDVKGKGKEQSSEAMDEDNDLKMNLEDVEDDTEEGQTSEADKKPASRRSILLTEYCGPHINPRELTQYQKLNIISLLDRFHNAEFLLGSISCRHTVVQPGPSRRFAPLCQTLKWARTWDQPSFRLDCFEKTNWCGLESERERVKNEFEGNNIELLIRQEKQFLKDHILVRGY